MIGWQPRNLYGPSLVRGRGASYLDRRFGNVGDRYFRQINFIAERFADKSVRDLEKLATALYVTRDRNTERALRAQQIVALKPHIAFTEANAAVQAVDELIQLAK